VLAPRVTFTISGVLKLCVVVYVCMYACRFSHAVVKAVLEEVSDEILRDKEYDAENSIALIKSVADEVLRKLQNSYALLAVTLRINEI